VNDSGQAVGAYYYSGRHYGFVDVGGTYTNVNVPGAADTYPQGINDAGRVVGYYQNASGYDEGFLDAGGTFTTITVSGATDTYVQGINSSGEMAGYTLSGAVYQGFIDTNGTFATISVPGATWTQVYGINDDGDLVGQYKSGSGQYAGFLATPDGAPLPVTGGTLPGAAVLFGWLGRRLARRQAA
jgi:hypothetical protein